MRGRVGVVPLHVHPRRAVVLAAGLALVVGAWAVVGITAEDAAMVDLVKGVDCSPTVQENRATQLVAYVSVRGPQVRRWLASSPARVACRACAVWGGGVLGVGELSLHVTPVFCFVCRRC